MKKYLVLLVGVGLLWSNVSLGATVNGVETDGPAPKAPEGGAAITVGPSLDATVIDFDGGTEPCSFNQTTALRAELAAQGVTFDGPGGALDGGGILDECSNFSVTGHSAPNFLAFNSGGNYLGGGTAIDPKPSRSVRR